MLRLSHQILLADRIEVLTGSNEQEVPSVAAARLNIVVNRLLSVPVFVVDNIYDYYKHSTITALNACETFPNVVPQFPEMFVEYKDGDVLVGVFIECADLRRAGMHIGTADGNEARWAVRLSFFTFDAKNGVAFYGITNTLAVKNNGNTDGTFRPVFDYPSLGNNFREYFQRMIPRPTRIALLSISFANCHNVDGDGVDVTSEIGPKPKWLRRMKQPEIKYRVLQIDGIKKSLSSIGNVEHNGIAKALHLVRGHFATYTTEKPLFGSFVGTVWKPSHVRGDLKNGAVIKDYSIKAD